MPLAIPVHDLVCVAYRSVDTVVEELIEGSSRVQGGNVVQIGMDEHLITRWLLWQISPVLRTSDRIAESLTSLVRLVMQKRHLLWSVSRDSGDAIDGGGWGSYEKDDLPMCRP